MTRTPLLTLQRKPRLNLGRTALMAVALLVLQSGCATTSRPSKDPMPAFFDGARILFQGDSITDGNRGRNADSNHVLGHGCQFIISAKYGAELAERHLTFMNRAISGNRVSDLARRWQKDTIDLKPDILSVLIGVNDLGSGVTVDQYEQQYDQLLADTANGLYELERERQRTKVDTFKSWVEQQTFSTAWPLLHR